MLRLSLVIDGTRREITARSKAQARVLQAAGWRPVTEAATPRKKKAAGKAAATEKEN